MLTVEPTESKLKGVFTEKPYSKPLERNVGYIPIITLSHARSRDFKINHGFLQSDWTSAT